MNKISVFAHRGIYDNQMIIENTLPAFEIALAQKLSIEFDVRLSKDNQVVVFHDASLKRLYHDKRKIRDLTMDQLKIRFNIPTLQEVLALVDAQASILLEIKQTNLSTKLIDKVMVELKNYEGEIMIQSFSPFVLWVLKKHYPTIKRGQLLMPAKKYANRFFGYVMNSLIFHPITKPDFYSYEKSMGKSRLKRWFFEKAAKQYAVWTLTESQSASLKNFSMKIMQYNLEDA